MNLPRRSFVAATTGTLLTPFAGAAFAADDFPSKPIRIVVPNAAGGTGDIVARLIGKGLGEKLKTAVVIDNRPGGNGVIGVTAVTRAAPDGYTLFSGPIGGLSAAFIKNPPFDVTKDFEGVSSMCRGGYMLFVNASLPIRTVKEFVDYARANPGKLNVGVVSPLSTLGFETLKKAMGIDAQTVPYKGSAPAVTALLGGEIHGTFDGPGTYVQMAQAGKVRGILFSTEPRLDTFANVPTPRESGYADYRAGYTTALWAPAGTPKDILDKLSKAVAEVVAMPDVQKTLRDNSLEPIAMTPEAVKLAGRSEVDFYMQAARAANVAPE